jgi:hypothetical protein
MTETLPMHHEEANVPDEVLESLIKEWQSQNGVGAPIYHQCARELQRRMKSHSGNVPDTDTNK